MKIVTGIFIWLVISMLAVRGLSLELQTTNTFIKVSMGVLGGPIIGIYDALVEGRFWSMFLIISIAIFFPLVPFLFYLRKKRLWLLYLAEVMWLMAGLIFAVGIGI
jgi:hypothetical protein